MQHESELILRSFQVAFSLLLCVHCYVFTSRHVHVIRVCQVADTLSNIIVLRSLKLWYIESDTCNNRVLRIKIKQFCLSVSLGRF
jgi:hypothetical protein